MGICGSAAARKRPPGKSPDRSPMAAWIDDGIIDTLSLSTVNRGDRRRARSTDG